MKKIISIILSMLIVISSISVGIYTYADEKDSDGIEEFINEASEMIAEFDSDKNYDVSSESMDFQTCRLIVEQSQHFNELNAVAVADGFENFHIVQFANEKDTEIAYNYYSASEDVISVSVDTVTELCNYNPDNSDFDTYDVTNMMNKSPDIMNISAAKQYILDNCSNYTKEIVVGVIDTGIMKEHEAIKGRFKGGKSFIKVPNGKATDGGYDNIGHGTNVAGVIIDSTLPNTKLMSYQIFTEDKKATNSASALAILQAIEDEVDVINMSLGGEGKDTLEEAAIQKAEDKNIKVVAASGNETYNFENTRVYPACFDTVITAGSIDQYFVKKTYSNYGKAVDIYALDDVYTSSYDGAYKWNKGTSFAAPYISGLCAMLTLLYPDETTAQTKQRLYSGSTQSVLQATGYYYAVDFLGVISLDNVEAQYTSTPVISITDTEYKNQKKVSISCEDENSTIYYLTETISSKLSPDNFRITKNEYTVKKYTSPFVIKEDSKIYATAIADKKLESDECSEYILVGYNSNGFYCDDKGIINWFVPEEYNGDINNIIVPDNIDGIIPQKFVDKIFTYSFFHNDLESITLPNSITEISQGCFYNCNKLKKIVANNIQFVDEYAFFQCKVLEDFNIFKNVERIGKYAFRDSGLKNIYSTYLKEVDSFAFYNNENLISIELPSLICCGQSAFSSNPNLESINMLSLTNCEDNSFSDNEKLISINMPSLISCGSNAFSNNPNLISVNMPALEKFSSNMFSNDTGLKEVYFPNCYGEQNNATNAFENTGLKSISLNLTYIPDNMFSGCNLDYAYFPEVDLYFSQCPIERMEFEKASILLFSETDYQPKIISVPSLCEIFLTDEEEEHISSNMVVYATQSDGNYIYEWCKENNVEFRNISQETAIITNLPDKISDLNTTLTADVIGFNRTYQWYANTEADNTTGTAIEGATDKTFTPADYPRADYYYCVVTSTDVGYEPVTIRTGVTQYIKENNVDYSAYNAALVTAQAIIDNPDYQTKYNDAVRKQFENDLESAKIDVMLDNSQMDVDLATAMILDLISNLCTDEYQIHVKVLIDNVEIDSTILNGNYGDKISINLGDINSKDYGSYDVEKWVVDSNTTSSSTIIARADKVLDKVVNDNLTVSVFLLSSPADVESYAKVTLLSATNSIIDIGYVKKGSIIDTSTAVVLSSDSVLGIAPILPFYNFDRWELNNSTVDSINADSDIVLKAKYTYTSNCCLIKSYSENVLINEKYNPIGYNAKYDEKVMVKSTDDKQLAMCDETGEIICYIKNTGYIHTPKTNMIIIKEIETAYASTAVTGSFITKIDNNRSKISFNCQFYIPDNCELVECGAVVTGNELVANDNNKFVIGAGNTLKTISQSQSDNNEYTISITADFGNRNKFYARSYLVYKDDNGNKKIIYSKTNILNLI